VTVVACGLLLDRARNGHGRATHYERAPDCVLHVNAGTDLGFCHVLATVAVGY
jgi:hypothetical protein